MNTLVLADSPPSLHLYTPELLTVTFFITNFPTKYIITVLLGSVHSMVLLFDDDELHLIVSSWPGCLIITSGWILISASEVYWVIITSSSSKRETILSSYTCCSTGKFNTENQSTKQK